MGKDSRKECGRRNLEVAAILEKRLPKEDVKVGLRPEGFWEAAWESCLRATVLGAAMERCQGRKCFVNICPLQE